VGGANIDPGPKQLALQPFQVLQFLLELKRSSWVLKQAFHWLKDCHIVDELKTRQLQTYRHEFQHFVNIMHGYVASQLFGLLWEEFQTELTQQSQTLDDVIQAHNKFVDRAIFRYVSYHACHESSGECDPYRKAMHHVLPNILYY